VDASMAAVAQVRGRLLKGGANAGKGTGRGTGRGCRVHAGQARAILLLLLHRSTILANRAKRMLAAAGKPPTPATSSCNTSCVRPYPAKQAERMRADADKLVARYSAPDRYMEVCEVRAGQAGLGRLCSAG